ncbi:serine/threonine-protein kinase [Frankia sp. CiP3]|uniref:serine/threonine-protein kinase n=1 Tax=Frankia sp. CiP3 TaxID=2880971 RepID=UPI001EF71D03|nr:serine/threonine-protein kinase [Frankia sp. CiP3]
MFELPELPEAPPSGPPPVLPEEDLPANLRLCGKCGSQVARDGAGSPAALDGMCQCGQPYSFTVKLVPGDLVAGRYKIIGRLAHGGQGWVYAARDEHLSHGQTELWVALKGLIDTESATARRAADAERRFLTSVSHPNIVKIRDFIVHDGADYTVMDYVRGVPLARLVKNKALPPGDAVRYLLRLLPALGYLHRIDLIYCDLKPDNVMVVSGDLVLIDLGGARRADDMAAGFASTAGFRAPELEYDSRAGASRRFPSVASDLYAATRTLAALLLGASWNPRKNLPFLPSADTFPVLRRFDSLHRFLRKGMAPDPAARFSTAEEMRDQLVGVLHELHVLDEGAPPDVIVSRCFEASPHDIGTERNSITWTDLAVLRVNPDDPAAPALLGLPARDDAEKVVAVLATMRPMTLEVRLRQVRAALEAGQPDTAGGLLDGIEQDEPGQWRARWYRGLIALATGDAPEAVRAFDHVYSQVPGELAPRVALAAAAEQAEDTQRAAELFDVVSSIDASVTDAALGLARCSRGTERIDAYKRVPPFSRAYVNARMRVIGLLVEPEPGAVPTVETLTEADLLLKELDRELGDERRLRLRYDVLSAGARLASSGTIPTGLTVLDLPLEKRALDTARSATLRELARYAKTRAELVRLVTDANQVRPWTWW